ncbi:MAG: hypothetical protein JRM82_03795 [Nitrososphaerota archaeon]|nr:hypothetical protein [Nitrososphaerota archaeon]
MDLQRACFLANEVVGLLTPYTTRIAVAGGIRRGKADPHDIEIVCEPKRNPVPTLDLPTALRSDAPNYAVLPGPDFVQFEVGRLLDRGVFQRGDPDKRGARAPCGPKYYRLRYLGEKLDIFVVIPPAQWGAVFAIRTGGAGFSHSLVQRGYAKGIHEISGHLELVKGEAGALVTQPFPHDEGKIPKSWQRAVIDTPEERDFFNALGVEWSDPKDRVTDPRHVGGV